MIYMHTSIWYIYVCIHIIDMYIYIYTYIHSSYVDRKIKRIQQCHVMRYTIEIWNNRAWTLKVRPVSHVRVKIRNSLACVRSTFSCHVLCLFLLVSNIQTDLLACVLGIIEANRIDLHVSSKKKESASFACPVYFLYHIFKAMSWIRLPLAEMACPYVSMWICLIAFPWALGSSYSENQAPLNQWPPPAFQSTFDWSL